MYHLQVLTPEQIIFDDEIVSLIAPGKEGYLGILTNHAPIITSLKPGVLVITEKNNKKSYYDVSTGFMEVNHNKASILVKTIKVAPPTDMGTGGSI